MAFKNDKYLINVLYFKKKYQLKLLPFFIIYRFFYLR